MTTSAVDTRHLAINTIRTLSMDAVQKANSGHPGTPMALAPVAYSLWNDHLNYDPQHPDWPGRDRFVLSCGHASMLLYSVLHLAGVKNPDGTPAVSIEDIKNFRQFGSPCAGHPEHGEAAGIETTTGPLGQGIANSVGMAISSKWMSERYQFAGCGFSVYALCSDGDIMEGVGMEAASLAGHLKLDNLCWIYDDNQITIEGRTDLAFSEDVAGKFESMGWDVVTIEDANDLAAIDSALEQFKQTEGQPTLIVLKSIIGYGAPNKQDTASAHGAPLGEEEIELAKQAYDWSAEKFDVPSGVMELFAENLGRRGAEAYQQWEAAWTDFASAQPAAAGDLQAIFERRLPDDWEAALPVFPADAKGMATRVSSGKVLNALAGPIGWLIGGSADLAGSNKSVIEDADAGHFSADQFSGRNFHFGIREHAMGSICNGMSLCGIRSYGATFAVFTDYMRPAMRLSGLMHQPVLYILTHDSIGLGEDGPTHQPVEHLAACRAIPNLLVMRPADANEVSQCYAAAIGEAKRPTAMFLTRQNVPTFDREKMGDAAGARCGGYILQDTSGNPDVILMGTGSEVEVCLEAAALLAEEQIAARVVSLPCFELFEAQPNEYRESVLPSGVAARVAVEAGIEMGWLRFLGRHGRFIGMNGFGASAPFEELYEHFGITADQVCQAAKEQVAASRN
ncbi:MAG: transketolase [Mariniblastus sp.]|nr:transketolase [Mariniblastus sp.]